MVQQESQIMEQLHLLLHLQLVNPQVAALLPATQGNNRDGPFRVSLVWVTGLNSGSKLFQWAQRTRRAPRSGSDFVKTSLASPSSDGVLDKSTPPFCTECMACWCTFHSRASPG